MSTAFFHFCFRQQSFTNNDSPATVSLCSASFSVSLPKIRFTQLDVKSRKNNEIIQKFNNYNFKLSVPLIATVKNAKFYSLSGCNVWDLQS